MFFVGYKKLLFSLLNIKTNGKGSQMKSKLVSVAFICISLSLLLSFQLKASLISTNVDGFSAFKSQNNVTYLNFSVTSNFTGLEVDKLILDGMLVNWRYATFAESVDLMLESFTLVKEGSSNYYDKGCCSFDGGLLESFWSDDAINHHLDLINNSDMDNFKLVSGSELYVQNEFQQFSWLFGETISYEDSMFGYVSRKSKGGFTDATAFQTDPLTSTIFDIINIHTFKGSKVTIPSNHLLVYNNSISVPEPSTIIIFALGLIGLSMRRIKN
jgi:hypothetical protein